jgi:Predicted permeases
MRLLARYLLRECLVPLGFCLAAFLMFWIASDLISSMQGLKEDKLKGSDIALYYFYKVPEFLPVAVPVALLLALLYALTNHARHNEITAMRAAGVSLWRISMPYFFIATVCAVGLFLMNELVAPTAVERAEDIRESRLRQRPGESRRFKKNFFFTNSREGRAWHIGIYDRERAEMQQVALDWQFRDGSVQSVFAELGVYTNRAWTFYQVREMRRAPGPDATTVRSQTNMVSYPEISETPEIIRSELSISERFAKEGRTRSANIPLRAIADYLRLHPNPERSIRAWLYTKLHGRFAAPVTCLVVVLLAIPFAAGSGRRNVFVGVAASIVIFFVYYILQQLGFAFAEAGRMPAWLGAWLPNILAAVTGLILLGRVR